MSNVLTTFLKRVTKKACLGLIVAKSTLINVAYAEIKRPTDECASPPVVVVVVGAIKE